MFKTISLIFILGLMVSCASYHHDRGISSVGGIEESDENRYERPSMGSSAGRY